MIGALAGDDLGLFVKRVGIELERGCLESLDFGMEEGMGSVVVVAMVLGGCGGCDCGGEFGVGENSGRHEWT